MARSRALVLALLLLPLAALGAACRPAGAEPGPPPTAGGVPPASAPGGAAAAASWKRVDQLISDQKLAEAAKELEALEADARARKDDRDLARVLIRQTQVGLALGGYETAVEALAAKDWPTEPLARAAVELYQAHALIGYLDAYGWEIARREKVVSGEQLDLKLWTRDQIVAAADRAFAAVWSLRADLGSVPAKDFEYLSANTYPERIRPTLRDAVSYLWAKRLADSSYWTAAEIQDTWKLDLPGLIAGTGVEPTAERLSDPAVHPLAKLAAVLGDLERWHRSRGEAGATLEARSERLEDLFFAFDAPEDQESIRTAFGRSLDEFRADPWWAMGQARWANLWKDGEEPDAAVRAREIAIAGENAYPGTPGAAACRSVRETIEAPSFEIQSMSVDAAGKRSIRISHRNLARLWFRAYRLPDERFGESKVQWRGWNEDRIRDVMADAPAAAWTQELAPTRDYGDHLDYTAPPLESDGRYLIVASAREDFRPRGNRLEAVVLTISDLVVERDPSFGRRGAEDSVRVVSGAAGAPVAGARAELFRWRWEQKPESIETVATDGEGLARFTRLDRIPAGQGLAVVVRPAAGGPEAVWSQGWGWQPPTPPTSEQGALIFTDRAIYRPGQDLLWKVLVYRGDRRHGHLSAAAKAPVAVRLIDPNGDRVDGAEATTNGFGAASGRLSIPTGRLLGNWTLQVDGGGSASIAVEEYKRPTFEVTLDAPAGESRLNRPVEIPGEARYYFGLPVASGRVAWRVTRAPMVLYGWRGWWEPPAPPRTIASGTAELGADGKFAIRFTPAADERERAGCGCYRFSVEAEVTDDGGETRSGGRSLALGWVAVTLSVEGDPFLVGPESERTWTLDRRDLDVTPRPGESSWRILELEQPAVTPLPADLPQAIAEADREWATPGDSLSPRWSAALTSEQIVAGWKAGREVAHGTLEHGADGTAALRLPELAPGAYRLVAESRDSHGETAKLEQSFVVAGGAASTPLALPLELRFERASVEVGGTARLFVHSGRPGQAVALEVVRGDEVLESRLWVAGRDPSWIEIPVGADDRGGFGARAMMVADHQVVERTAAETVPWSDKKLTLELATFRDKLEPGATETYRVIVRDSDGKPVGAGAAELVASMYDRSLDFFQPHPVPQVSSLYPAWGAPAEWLDNLGPAVRAWAGGRDWAEVSAWPSFRADAFVAIDPYGIGGPGRGALRYLAKGAVAMDAAAPAPAVQAAAESITVTAGAPVSRTVLGVASPEEMKQGRRAEPATAAVPLRSNFAETAFWQPHLTTAADGSVAIEFQVPESLTSWKLWIAGWTRELVSGTLEREVETAKELMVRPYLPRFLREGDRADLKVTVQDAGKGPLAGTVRLAIVDPETKQDLSADFGLPAGGGEADFSARPGEGTTVTFPVTTPRGPRPVAFRVEARSGALSDGELRPLPVLPSRIELAQSRFVALSGAERRELVFGDMTKPDPTRIDDSLVVTVDGQLFYSLLDALPYLVDYPYECTEQTLNRFVSTGILASLFDRYPAVATMAKELAKRDTRYERFDAEDPNRRMALEETPWLREARGGDGTDQALLRVLDPDVARAQQADALGKLRQAQLPSGAFPWFPGGRPSPFMTLYLLDGFARAASFGVDVPKEMVQRGWKYLAGEIERDWWRQAIAHDCCWELLTYANYVASSYPDPSWMGDVLPVSKRREILDFSFKHWRDHSPMLKLELASTLHRMDRDADARKVLAAVMDSARTDRDLGTYWAPEDRAWLWYNDTIETQAWALRTLTEITPDDPRATGLVQWLFLNKKLNHWKSTRATAEVLYSLAVYLEREHLIGAPQQVKVELGGRTTTFDFEPDRYTGKKNQIVLPGDEIRPERDSKVVVEQTTPGTAFASATWHFSTEQLPEEARGDLFHVERRWFRRVKTGPEVTLTPLAEGERLAVGDELEVQLSITAKAAAEYVHLRDPRAAGLEPDTSKSGWRWDLGIAWYQETRDSGTDFFFEQLPAGEYTLKYRLRAATAGTFRAAPAQLDSMYAPEFVAYSSGERLTIAP
jgi:hypothetical protein